MLLTHVGLINVFGKEYVLGEGFDSNLASQFSSAESARENASYPSYDYFTSEQACDQIKLAEKFFNEAKIFL